MTARICEPVGVAPLEVVVGGSDAGELDDAGGEAGVVVALGAAAPGTHCE